MRKQTSKESNRIIWAMAGRIARSQNEPISACPNLKSGENDTYGAWLMDQWRKGWEEQDQKIRQPLLTGNCSVGDPTEAGSR